MFKFKDSTLDKTFTEGFIAQRIDHCLKETVVPRADRQRLLDYQEEILDKVREEISSSPELQKLLDEYEKLNTEEDKLEQEFVYRQGFSDGMKFVLGGLINE
ncbi:hypothetical protein L7E55_02360 [Pelotomaculum isophthalicicum JI]|uniref:Uncharacterized protein n=1 Tax=Pelotomaculum isophthalicicum JI TaxID=947010 RepID=A0A9X4H4D5_9FIRM|nr:hypothetical protein [Pelotomaculum isophthalicicum]MDF9407208.1 hypothetical protein [Pelotomaculum isophthalicicum JI]